MSGAVRSGILGWGVLVICVFWMAGPLPVAAADHPQQAWGFGWDDGLTVRRWLGTGWELALSAGPDDYLTKTESQAWLLSVPAQQHGALQVPEDHRQEHGWVRAQVGRLVTRRGDLALVGYTGLVYNWIDYQERSLVLDTLIGDYDTWESDRFTERWILTLGVRPSWRPTAFLTVEFALGLNFVWESWDQTTTRTYAGVAGGDQTRDQGHSRSFSDFGWEGASSLQFFFWF
jgi:hypothetical protein